MITPIVQFATNAKILYDNLNELPKAYFYLNIIIFFWFSGYLFISRNNRLNFNFNPVCSGDRDKIFFAKIMIILGFILYFILLLYVHIDLIYAYKNPLLTRYKIIEKTGGYFLMKMSYWYLLGGVSILLIVSNEGRFKRKSFIIIIIFLLLIFLYLPFGKRTLIMYIILDGIVIMYYKKKIKVSIILLIFIMSIILLLLLGMYREMRYNKNIFSFSMLLKKIMAYNYKRLFQRLVERFDLINYFCFFIKNKDVIHISFSDSIFSFILRFFPVSVISINKPLDINGLLTLSKFGNFRYGTYDFTPFAEWYIYISTAGFLIFPFFSGITFAILEKYLSKISKASVFWTLLFVDFVFLKTAFLSINYARNVEIILLFLFAIFNSIIYKILKTNSKEN